jgi:hypothetical protein
MTTPPRALGAPQGRPYSVMAFTVADGRIAAIDVLADPIARTS